MTIDYANEYTIRKCLTKLVRAVDAATSHFSYHNNFTIAKIHGMDYTGPNFKTELDDARELVEFLNTTRGVIPDE